MTFSMIFQLIGGLGLFLFGMRVMSEGLQNAAGRSLRRILGTITGRRVAGVLTGLMVTAAIQSSSATTVMVVSFVNAGLLTLKQAVGVIMGANIGTTVTGWVVSILGFKVKIATFALPAVGIGVLARFFIKGKQGLWLEALVGFGLLFLGLQFMKDSVPDIRSDPEALEMMARYSASTLPSVILAILVGSLVTFVVQSSSATMAITIAASAKGFIDFPTACALVLGENIGTTVTALLSSLGGNTSARRAAVAHLLFNVIGVIWMLAMFRPFLGFVDRLVPGAVSGHAEAIPVHLAAFHTAFNMTNTLLFLPLVGVIVRAVTALVPGDVEEVFSLKPFDTQTVRIPSMALAEARQQLVKMCQLVTEMLTISLKVFRSPHRKMGEEVLRVRRREDAVDTLEREITRFCAQLSRAPLSPEGARETAHIMAIASELERIGDHSELVLKHSNRLFDNRITFTSAAMGEIDQIADEVKGFLQLILESIENESFDGLMERARQYETRIDELRTLMKNEHISRLKEGSCSVDAGLVFLDMVTSFEKMGDHAYNIAEELAGIK